MLTLNSQTPLKQWLSYLESSHDKTIDLGLERIFKVASNLDLLKPAPYVIIVGGTNGKGTTCRLLEMLFLQIGLKVGVYSSPHILDYRERVRINDQLLSEAEHCQSFDFIEKHKIISLSYFEFSTLSALNLFKQHNLDVVILEVGLGGRLDATNVVDSDMAIITSIDFDHMTFLGNTLEEIGYEKAGIFRANKPAIIGESSLPNSVKIFSQQLNCLVVQKDKDWHIEEYGDYWNFYGNFKNHKIEYNHLPIPKIPVANASTVLASLAYMPFNFTADDITQALRKVSLWGRFQYLSENLYTKLADKLNLTLEEVKNLPQIILDVGHNPHAGRYLVQQIRKNCTNSEGKIAGICGVLKDKDLAGILQPLVNQIDIWCGLTLVGQRGQSGKDIINCLQKCMDNKQLKTIDAENISEALLKLLPKLNKNDYLIIFGSFHTVANFYNFLDMKELFS